MLIKELDLDCLMKKSYFTATLLALLVLTLILVAFVYMNIESNEPQIKRYTCQVVNVYPHDQTAFTQGLVFENNFLYESTGLYGYSTLRQVKLETGEILQLYHLPNHFFGEGITIFNDTIIQLTWQSHIGFVYDKQSFKLLQEFSYPTEGWGITPDGTRLIMSDGTANLYFLDPEKFQRIGQIEVRDGDTPIKNLNELEFIKGKIYANILGEDKIAIINPLTGQVSGWIDLSGLGPVNRDSGNVANGIAYDENGERIFVTGKMWPQVYEIKLIPLK